jgi:hypothetical protein
VSVDSSLEQLAAELGDRADGAKKLCAEPPPGRYLGRISAVWTVPT